VWWLKKGREIFWAKKTNPPQDTPRFLDPSLNLMGLESGRHVSSVVKCRKLTIGSRNVLILYKCHLVSPTLACTCYTRETIPLKLGLKWTATWQDISVSRWAKNRTIVKSLQLLYSICWQKDVPYIKLSGLISAGLADVEFRQMWIFLVRFLAHRILFDW